ncbi:MAG: hypothetical protein JSW39_10685 [Desulfobacterales bacterium]|nr:MAG: hypothetical protein JSW39_10685 [Desulfobacterales bacterium]
MDNLKWVVWFLMFAGFTSLPVAAGDFDGSQPLLCAPIDVIECTSGGQCQKVSAESIRLPQFLRINFAEKKIGAASGGEGAPTTSIKTMEHIDGKLILNGAEDGIEGVRDGLGWSMAIAEETGKMVLTASGDEVGFVVFGACLAQ